MNSHPAYRIFPLGDAAMTIDFGNVINMDFNKRVQGLFCFLQKNPFPGMIEAVPAYSSLTVYYDLLALKKKATDENSVYDWAKKQLEEIVAKTNNAEETKSRLVEIPVCYENSFAPGINELSFLKKISVEEIIRIHTAKQYHVYMLGFLPGFAYMGEVDEAISIPRKQQPENVAAGSVGIAGIQTGIYPLASPGGWCIIGRTPLELFNADGDGETLLKAGDTVQFISITKDEFEGYQSRHS
jgi:inhibitor of KinA